MLTVISDLHFEEEARDTIADRQDPPNHVGLTRNLPASAFRSTVADLAVEAEQNHARQLDLVLAGDVFDLQRTQMWFDDDLRPYVSCAEVSPALETKILAVLDAIAAEPTVAECLEVFKNLTAGRYVAGANDPTQLSHFPIPVTLHYLPGNHDRLLTASATLRRHTRQLLGLPDADDAMPHQLLFDDPRVLVRHGHEYDPQNFSADHTQSNPFPSTLPASEYDAAPFGDFLTIDVAGRLPHLFRKTYGDEQIVADPDLRRMYIRLLEFDDVRPQSALLPFLLSIPDSGWTPEMAWSKLQPVVCALLDSISDDAFFRGWLRKLEQNSPMADVTESMLDSKPWRFGLSLNLMHFIGGQTMGSGAAPDVSQTAAREEIVQKGAVRFVVAGHTHEPQVAFIDGSGELDRYYVDTGTWRRRVLMSPDGSSFAALKALTYVTVYASAEDQGRQTPAQSKRESFDYWSGFTQRWR